MRRFVRRNRERASVGAAFVGPFLLSLSLVLFRGSNANTAAALMMVAMIAVIAVLGNRWSGVIASVSAAVWFDFFLTPPYLRLTISHRPDLETTISLLVVGLFITELAARSRHHEERANETLRFVTMIHAIADLASNATATPSIIDVSTSSLVEILHLRACRFDAELVEPPLARIEATGEVVHVGLHWPVHDIGIPGPEAEIVAQWKGRTLGRFVLTPTSGKPVSLERRLVAASLVDVVAASLMDQDLAW